MSGNQLKWLAIFSMTIDHIGYVLVEHGSTLYVVCRSVGRLAFPIFCFLLSEGMRHTKSRARYLARLTLFALLSEIPFDLAFNDSVLETQSQNVFFTLALGLLGICLYERLAARYREGALIAPLLCMFLSLCLHTDYDAFGVLMITLCWLFRDRRYVQMGGIVLSNLLIRLGTVSRQLIGCAALLPIFLYNGKRGRGGKLNQYSFYAFYPLHLLLLWLLTQLPRFH